jgi:hypothetical protein
MVVAMLAEIFMVRSEAEARLVEEVLPSSASRFIPFSPSSQFVFKETDLKGEEAPSEERPRQMMYATPDCGLHHGHRGLAAEPGPREV